MKGTPEVETQPDAVAPHGRRTERVMLAIPIRVMIPIQVHSYGGLGGEFNEDTYTVTVNRDGALIASKHRLVPEETIRIVNMENLREADFRVVGLARQETGEVSEWGVECVDKDRSIWEIDFPPPLARNEPKGGVLLQCRGCGKQSLLVLSLTEISILEARESLERLCEKCGELSSWEYVDALRRPKKLALSVEPAAAPGQVEWDGKTERRSVATPPAAIPEGRNGKIERRRAAPVPSGKPGEAPPVPHGGRWDGKTDKRITRRVTMKLPVLVRNHKGETEIGRTENLSKSGLGVALDMALALSERVKLVCPYSGSGNEIEQKAEVRRRIPLGGGQRWLYGFRYVTQ